MKVLFIHQNFPGQFRHIAAHLATQPGVSVRAIGREKAPGLKDVPMWRYEPHRSPGKQTHPYARTFEEAVLHGQQVLRLLMQQASLGYHPDIVIAHPGWGETLYLKQVYPGTPLIHFCEYYYHTKGADADFDPEFPLSPHGAAAIESRNALHLLNLEHCDIAITPTKWQYSLQPEAYRHKLRVVHEGIDLDNLRPDPQAVLNLPNGKTLRAGDPVVTYVARNLEPYRGFHQFMRALPTVLDKHPTCQVVILGADGVSYGRPPEGVPNWRTKLLRENPMDASRVHFLGKVAHDVYRTVLQISAVHVYLTYPFVLSWSLLEAMACGCIVVGSDTAPVREVIEESSNGLLVKFFDKNRLVSHLLNTLLDPDQIRSVGARAALTSKRYSSSRGIALYMGIVNELLSKK